MALPIIGTTYGHRLLSGRSAWLVLATFFVSLSYGDSSLVIALQVSIRCPAYWGFDNIIEFD
ncbi:hypothetical protein TUM4261_41930 [Shewanella sp. c952]|nr:hypothetical protein TUM4261_41930 [Shewanella sp. c952]